MPAHAKITRSVGGLSDALLVVLHKGPVSSISVPERSKIIFLSNLATTRCGTRADSWVNTEFVLEDGNYRQGGRRRPSRNRFQISNDGRLGTTSPGTGTSFGFPEVPGNSGDRLGDFSE